MYIQRRVWDSKQTSTNSVSILFSLENRPRALTITLLYLQGCNTEGELASFCMARCNLIHYKKIPKQ